MDPNTEIRKLPPSIVRELASILDYADSWKRLMAIIPKRLSRNGYNSDITADNLAKYHSEHFKIIEEGAIKYDRSCTAILVEEWGTSGRPRASLGHLKYLLTKAELFRAADYVAKLLGEAPPPRPATGPAAKVKIDASEIAESIAEVERGLNKINYPQAAIQRIREKESEVKKHVTATPTILVTEVKTTRESLQIPLVIPVPKEKSHTPLEGNANVQQAGYVDNMASVIVPDISNLLQGSHESEITETSSTQYERTNINSEFIPAISQILNYNENSVNSTNSEETSEIDTSSYIESDFIPAFSQLNSQIANNTNSLIPKFNSDVVPNSDVMPKSNSDLIPNFDMLQMSYRSDSLNIPLSKPNTSRSSTSPNLVINTQLPHFTYNELETATNNFSCDKENRRFLGAGAFGSVFLATRLFDIPVAVKNIFRYNNEISQEKLNKQFRNEVEILYKYKHENLVSLLGYSCDGPVPCLVYEYVPGGSLFDVIQNRPLSILWKQRLQISLGSAKGIAYLHTAYKTSLIHRDIKSANILLDDKNNAKICDFGIVKLLPNQDTELESAPCGTSAYMAPEYHNGEISVKIDTFSFGVVLLELLTSLPPLDNNRPGGDLVTYVEDNCENSIDSLLDKTIGTWEENGTNFAKEIYDLTLKCLERKELRPEMVDVMKSLENLQEKLIS